MRYKVKIAWKVIYYVHTEPSIGKYKLRIMNLNWINQRVECPVNQSERRQVDDLVYRVISKNSPYNIFLIF